MIMILMCFFSIFIVAKLLVKGVPTAFRSVAAAVNVHSTMDDATRVHG